MLPEDIEKRLSKCRREMKVPREGDSDERADHKVEERINHNVDPYVPERLHLRWREYSGCLIESEDVT
jgi:hypothetical protein